MKLRICKKNLKKSMRESGLRIVATHGRTFVFAPKPGGCKTTEECTATIDLHNAGHK